MATKKTNGFDRFLDEQLRRPGVAKAYADERAEIDAIDAVIRTLDAARVQMGISKAELARRISASPEAVRRLLTGKNPNPTMQTVLRILNVVRLQLAFLPAEETTPAPVARSTSQAATRSPSRPAARSTSGAHRRKVAATA